jgi:hypothetical protein
MVDAAPKAAETEAELEVVAERLTALARTLGADYWRNREVRDLQERLRRLIGRAGAWSEDGLPMHRRARRTAAYESRFARLLWPGPADEGA